MKNLWIFVMLTTTFIGLACLYPVWWTLLLVGLWLIRLYGFKHKQVWYYSCLAGLCVVFAVGIKQQQRSVLSEEINNGKITISAHTINVNGDLVTAKGHLKNEQINVYLQLKTPQEQLFWLENTDDVSLAANFSLQPYALPRNPHQFNYRQYMQRYQNSYWQAKLTDYKVLWRAPNWSKQLQMLWQKNLPSKLSELIGSLFFNETNDISETFQQVGLLSLVNLSGLHITWLFQGITYFFLRLGITKEKTTICVYLFATLLWLFLSPSIGIKKSILLFYIQNKGTYLDRLSWLTILFIFINPYYLFHLGFQFSFGVSLFKYLFKKQPARLVLISMPLLSYYFFEINFIPLLIGVPLLKLFKYIIFPTLLFIKFIPFIIPFVEYSIEKLTTIIQFLATQQELIWVTGRLSEERYIAIILVLLIYFSLHQTLLKVIKPILLCILLLLFCPIQYEQITMLDVGQGSSLLIQTGGEALLIDTGGKLDFATKDKWKKRVQKSLAKAVLVPTLKSLGIKKLSGVMITHADADHYQALADLKQFIPISAIYYGKGAPIAGTHALVAPERIKLSQLELTVLYPFKAGEGKNDDSLILFLSFGGLRWLITGDASETIEKELIQLYPTLKIDALVVGHHGSQTSTHSLFIQHIVPKYSLISVGENNRYGHPHAIVLERLKGTKIYRTDKMGAIRYSLKNKEKKWEITLSENDNR